MAPAGILRPLAVSVAAGAIGSAAALGALLVPVLTGTALTVPLATVVALAGLVLAIGPAAFVFLHVLPRLRAERATSVARARILEAIEDGCFLLDSGRKVRGPTSAALARLLGRERFEGADFVELIAPFTDEKLRATAADYVGVLWSERVNESLVRTLNPLQDLALPPVEPGIPPRHLAFEFRRVLEGERTAYVLVTVRDVTRQHALAAELREAQARLQSQLDLLTSVLQIEPGRLRDFLQAAQIAVQSVQSTLRLPAREEAAFRDKLERILGQISVLRERSAALGLGELEVRAGEFESQLAELRARPRLTGNDLLPLAVGLDALFNQLATIRELFGRLGSQEHDLALLEAEPEPASPSVEAMLEDLQRLTQQLANGEGKKATLVCLGFEQLPELYARALFDIVAQLVRHAIARGIEPVVERVALAKPAAGTLVAELADLGGDGGLELTFQDDGRGLDHEAIKRTAVARGLLKAEVAERLDPRRLASFIFRPEFAGRDGDAADDGIGMSGLRDLVTRLGGRISVATKAGAFTRFHVNLPPAQREMRDTGQFSLRRTSGTGTI